MPRCKKIKLLQFRLTFRLAFASLKNYTQKKAVHLCTLFIYTYTNTYTVKQNGTNEASVNQNGTNGTLVPDFRA